MNKSTHVLKPGDVSDVGIGLYVALEVDVVASIDLIFLKRHTQRHFNLRGICKVGLRRKRIDERFLHVTRKTPTLYFEKLGRSQRRVERSVHDDALE